jgi:hypothetical protein
MTLREPDQVNPASARAGLKRSLAACRLARVPAQQLSIDPTEKDHASAGTCRIAPSSVAVIIHPQVNSTARREENIASR